jgi:hypothetical protein
MLRAQPAGRPPPRSPPSSAESTGRSPTCWSAGAAPAAGLLASFIADLDVPTCGGMVNGTLDEHACWAVRTMYHYLPQLPDEARRDLTRALFTS